MKKVYYFCKSHIMGGGLVFPNELPQNYTAKGGLYIPGETVPKINHNMLPMEEYTIHAVYHEEIIELKLKHMAESKNILLTQVNDIGDFFFNVRKIKRIAYTGIHSTARGIVVERQITPLNWIKFERACFNRNFYFIGYSPTIETKNRE